MYLLRADHYFHSIDEGRPTLPLPSTEWDLFSINGNRSLGFEIWSSCQTHGRHRREGVSLSLFRLALASGPVSHTLLKLVGNQLHSMALKIFYLYVI